MASSEHEKTTVKHRNSILHGDIFSWTFEIRKQDMEISSDMFLFGGYCCYLKFTSYVSIWKGKAFGQFNISLHGYPSPCKKNMSCKYSLFMKNREGKLHINKPGEIHRLKENINSVLHKGELLYDILNVTTICFTWLENGDDEVFSPDTQTKPEISRNVFEQSTQTDENGPSQTLKFRSNSENETYKFLEILSKDLDIFYGDKTGSDCVLKVGETKFPVHRCVLSARSSVFAAMFYHDTSESRSGEVDIQDMDNTVFGDVLYYIYSGRIRGLSPDTAASMYIAADKYALIELRDKCMDFLMLNLNVENVVDAVLVAQVHAEEQLENKIINFIEDNLEEVTAHEMWILFADSHSKIANKILCSAFISSKKKMKK